MISQAVWLYRTRMIRKRAKEADMSWGDFPEAQKWQDDRWKFPWKPSRLWNPDNSKHEIIADIEHTVEDQIERQVDLIET